MRLRDIPLPIKIVIWLAFPPSLVVWFFASVIVVEIAFNKAKKNPCIETVDYLIDTLKRIKLGIINRPHNWNDIRKTWYIVNGSNRVPTPMKQELLAVFIKKGTKINNKKIIDNYKG